MIKKIYSVQKELLLIKLFITLIIILVCVNLFAMFSIAGGVVDHLVSKQISITLISLLIALIFSIINIRFIFSNSYYIYLLVLLSLVVTDLLGYKAMGAKRWINLGFINIQPSEFMKIAVILALSRFFHNCHINNIKKYRHLLFPLGIILLPTLLILKQPNLGTSLIIILTSLTILFITGVKIQLFICLGLSTILSLPIIWRFLHDYQKARILTFLDPSSDTLGAGYNIIQSIISIGSGGLFGKGFLKGPQNQLDFLPENHTDFVFGLIAEEGGFILCSLLLITYSLIIIIMYIISIQCLSHFYRIFILGFASLLFFHIVINIGMISRLLPVVGVPLPLLSYGGSNYLSIMIGIGLVINIYLNKTKILSKGS